MEVRCDRCQTEHKLEDAHAGGSGGSVQCSDCGHVILVGAGVTSTPILSGPDTPPPETGDWRVETTHGRSLRAPDVATLHRWIIERRITREDRISREGQASQRIGDVAELAPFFEVADSAERTRRADTPGPMLLQEVLLTPPPPRSATAGMAAHAGAFPVAEEHTETKILVVRPSRFTLPLKLALTTLVAGLVAFTGIAVQQRLAQSRAGAQPSPLALPAGRAGSVEFPIPAPVAPPAPSAEIEPLAETAEPQAAAEPRPAPVLSPKKARAARLAAARASKANAAPVPRGKVATAVPAAGPSPQIVAAQGYAALNRRQYPQAIELFKQALTGSPLNGTALFGLAEAYRESGLKSAALKAYRRYVQLLPSGPDAGSARLQIRLLEGKSK
jgi:predicted Zn finger-like uncharacterized protein